MRFVLSRLFQSLVDAEAGWLLSWRELLKGLEILPNQRLGRHEKEHPVCRPLVIEHLRFFVGALEWITPHVKEFRKPQRHEWFLPHVKTFRPLYHEVDLVL